METTTANPAPIHQSIVQCFQTLPDPRMKRTRKHLLIDILTIGLCSTLAGGTTFTDMVIFGKSQIEWLKTFLELPHGIPSRDTFNRVFSAIDPDLFLDCFVQWVQGLCTALGREVVAIDGKALRHALNAGDKLPYIVSAWASEHGLVLGQVKVDDKSNEITAIPELLRVLELKGCIITIDAMGCQKDIAAKIVDKEADYVLALKGNQGTAHEEIKEYFADAVPAGAVSFEDIGAPQGMDFFQTVDKGHGRIEIRRYWQTNDIEWFEDKGLWKNLSTFAMVESVRIINGEKTTERRYFLSCLPLDVQLLAKAVRGHWGVENPLHWTLDVTFGEDSSRARAKNAAQNLAMLRRIALNLVKNNRTEKLSVRGKRFLAALSPAYLGQLLGI